MTRAEYAMIQSATRSLAQAIPDLRARDRRALELLQECVAILKALELGSQVVVPKSS